jgi:hypothetical protein
MSTSARGSSKWAAIGLILAAVVCYAEVRDSEKVLWLDFDMQNIPEPKERDGGAYEVFFKGQIIEQTKQELDVPRVARAIVSEKKQAANVNVLDEVPDSSWYTNRHHLRKMTIDELVRGPNRSVGPDLSRAVITRAKTEGVTPGLQLKDAKGDSYLIKFDNANWPELQSGAEVIATKILYAAGYNVPENYLGFLDIKQLQIDKKVEIVDPKTRMPRALTRDDLDEMLRRVARMPDGRYRVLASKLLAGKPKGPFAYIGIRRDDPNDLIPHEHRRELRGMRVITSWINHWDLKEDNTLDMYVEDHGRKFLRHYLIDFGSALGGGRDPMEYFHGREYAFDVGSITKEVFSLGLYKSAAEKRGMMISPAVGILSADDFDPGHWRPTYPVMPFDNMTKEDAYWGARVILAFTEPELRAIVESAEYTNPKDTEYMLRTLLERRAIVARHWLRKADGLAGFSIEPSSNGIALKFRDLMVDSKLADRNATQYTFQIRGPRYESAKQTIGEPMLRIDRGMLGAAIEKADSDEQIEIWVWTNRQGSNSDPVKVHFDWSPTRETPSIRRISRG